MAVAAAAISALGIGLAGPVRAQPADFEVRLERTGCLGTCPSYVVTIHRDGLVEYEGRSWVKAHGRRSARISPKAVQDLFDKVQAAHFFELAPSYRAGITDQATYILTVREGGSAHVVEDYAGRLIGMPSVVTDLEMAVDQAAGVERWIGSPEERRRGMRR
jgi:hypothetical protein